MRALADMRCAFVDLFAIVDKFVHELCFVGDFYALWLEIGCSPATKLVSDRIVVRNRMFASHQVGQ